MKLRHVDKPDDMFFNFLPLDWQEELLPQWDRLKDGSEVYVLEHNGKIVCMGILFADKLPYLSPLEKAVAPQLKDYIYLGYIYTLPEFRGQGFATLWFDLILKKYPQSSFWLTIENLQLESFYAQWGFKKYTSNKTYADFEELCMVLSRDS